MVIHMGISSAQQFAHHTTGISAAVQQMKLIVLLSVYDGGNEGSV